MKCCIVTLYDKNFELFISYVIKSFEHFANINNCDLLIFNNLINPNLAPSWNKLLAVQKAFSNGFEQVLWTDADSLYISSFKFDFNKENDLIINSDSNGVCFSHFCIKNTIYNQNLLQTMLFLGDVKAPSKFGHNQCFWEQNCFKALIENFNIPFSTFPTKTVIEAGILEKPIHNTQFIHFGFMNNSLRETLIKEEYFSRY